MVFRLMAIGRLERDLINVVNTGVLSPRLLPFADPGLFGENQTLPVFNRPVSTFGADRYVLTNPVDPQTDQTTFVGAELTGQRQTERLYLLVGVTAGRSEGISANRGFRAIENDAALLGEVFTNPNARTYAQGRLFNDAVYDQGRDGTDSRTISARVAALSGRRALLATGDREPESGSSWCARSNGRTRFTFTGTLDARAEGLHLRHAADCAGARGLQHPGHGTRSKSSS
jgi:hypothetical protein